MDIQKEREVFEEWVDSEFNDHNWYLESKDQRNLHQYREELDDYWQYEETLLWSAWQADKAIPDGFVVMPKEPTQNIYRTFYDAFNSADTGNTAQNFKVAYKAMIEAQE